ncbi:MAG: hypothetical protein IKN86_01850 [Bacteroidaceae bacterium]|nr:hypothetical protein [Bacteroidaceae bacterium]
MKKTLLSMLTAATIWLCSTTGWSQTTIEIGTAEEYAAFAARVNEGERSLSAVLTADIDLTAYQGEDFPMLGANDGDNIDHEYHGTLDGAGHKVIYNFTGWRHWTGLIGALGTNGVVKNLELYGSQTTEWLCIGTLVGYLNGGTISHCFSHVTLNLTATGLCNCAGLVGSVGWGGLIEYSGWDGNIVSETATDCAGLVGWAGYGVTINNCLCAGTIPEGGNACTISRNMDAAAITNCYFLNEYQDTRNGSIQITEEDLASGRACWLLNGGGLTGTGWFQTLNEDKMPTPNSTHNIIYSTDGGVTFCELSSDVNSFQQFIGTVKDEADEFLSDENIDYGNTDAYQEALAALAASTAKEEMIANYETVVHERNKLEANALLKISSAEEYVNYAAQIKAGTTNMSAKLVADIDLTEYNENFPFLGTTEVPFTKIFDGDGHTIIVNFSSGDHYAGLSQALSGIFRNIVLEGSISCGGLCNGSFVGNLMGGTVQNCVSHATLNMSVAGLCASGGIVGATSGNNSSLVENCLFDGQMESGSATNNGGIIGWPAASETTARNCIFAGTLPEEGAYTISVINAPVSCQNCYYLNVYQGINAGSSQVSEEQLKSGELCYMLNGNKVGQNWFQTLDEDKTPLPYSTHGIVYKAGEEYYNLTEEENSIQQYCELQLEEADTYLSKHLFQTSLKEPYLQALEALKQNSTIKDLLAAIETTNQMLDEIVNSVAAYEHYQGKIDEIKTFIEENGNTFEMTPFLRRYLEESIEPCEQYTCGSYLFIIENCLLNNEELAAEEVRAQQLLDDAVNGGYGPGADVTTLLLNASFAQDDKASGWESDGGFNGYVVDAGGVMRVLAMNSCPMNIHQTIKDVKNGFYIYQISGYTEVDAMDPEAVYNYTGLVYANDNKNYMQTQRSGLVPIEAGEKYGNDVEMVYNGDWEETGYAPYTYTGMGYVFADGYYTNSILVNVTDGTLTVGTNNEGVNDRLCMTYMGNVKLTYLGNLEEAADQIDALLNDMIKKANHLLNDYLVLFENMDAPNYSTNLKDELKACITSNNLSTTEQKYEAIVRLGKLFADIIASKQAYTQLITFNDKLLDLYYNYLPEDMRNGYDETYYQVLDIYNEGALTTDEVIAKIEELKQDENYQKFIVEYPIGTAEEFVEFSNLLKQGALINYAVLKADIDLTAYQGEDFPFIGTTAVPYAGTLNGNGHTIKVNFTSNEHYAGLSQALQGTFQNIIMEGTITAGGLCNGSFVGHLQAGKILNCVSHVNMILTVEGLCASGGIVGASNNCLVENCLFDGKLISETATNNAGIAGWPCGGEVVRNCLFTGTIPKGDDWNIVYGANGAVYTCVNCYYLNAYASNNADCTQVTEEQLRSGEVCWLLNNGHTDELAGWGQLLGTDETPLPDATRGIVGKQSDGTYCNVTDAIQEIASQPNVLSKGIYNILGQKVQKVQKGLYIIDGKKVMVK